MLCDYGCGQEAKYFFKNGKKCCCKIIVKCPEIRKLCGVKKDINDIKQSLKSIGYICLSEKYNNANEKLKFKCPKGHTFETYWSFIRRNLRCSICSGKRKKTIKEIKEYMKSQGYDLLSNMYKNSFSILKVRCQEGHEYSTSWDGFHNSKSRCPKCADIKHSKEMKGKNNPNWKGGISQEEYSLIWYNENFKKMIRKRDGNKCLNPKCKNKNPKRITIHHINYNKKDCSIKNLITICQSCNAKANKNREFHEKYYQTILENLYNYSYI